MALITQSELEARLRRSLSTEEQNDFTLINSAVQTEIEKIIGSSVESVNSSTRYYDGGLQHLRIDPCTEVTSVIQVDDDYATVYTYDSSDYTIDPKNKTLKRMIRHRDTGGFVTGINNIAVTAKFSIYGDEGIRNIIKNVILGVLESELTKSDNLIKESIEGYSVEFATEQTKDALKSVKYLFPEI